MNCCNTYNIDCSQGRDCPARKEPASIWTSGNVGNTVTDGHALPPHEDGDESSNVTGGLVLALGLTACAWLAAYFIFHLMT